MTLLNNISKAFALTTLALFIALRIFSDTVFYFFASIDSNIFTLWIFFTSIVIFASFIFYFFSNQYEQIYSNEQFLSKFNRIFLLLFIIFLINIFLPENSTLYFPEQPYYKFIVSDLSSILFVIVAIYLAWFIFLWLQSKRHKRTNLYLKIVGIAFLLLFVFDIISYFGISKFISHIDNFFYIIIYILILLVTKKNSWIAQLDRKSKIKLLLVSFANFIFTILLVNNALDVNSFSSNEVATFFVGGNNFIAAVALSLNAFSLRLFLAVLAALPTANIVERKSSEIFSLTYLNKFIAETATKKTDELHTLVTQLALNACGGVGAWIEVYENDSIQLGAASQIPYELIQNFHSDERYGSIFTLIEKPLLIESVPENDEINPILNYLPYANSLIAVPVFQGKKRYGTLITVDTEEYGFEPEDVSILAAFADNINLALENQRLLRESIEKERYRSEMLIAKRIQKELLPQELPQFSKFKIAAFSSPAEEVGGDYYDVTYFADGKPCVLIGDVSGKGMSAAFYMAQLKGAVHSIAPLSYSPKELLVKLNEILYNLMDKQSYITLICVKLDEMQNKIVFARAGHPPIFINNGNNVLTLQPKGLGVALVRSDFFSSVLEEVEIPLQYNSNCIMITDGVNETYNSDGNEFNFMLIKEFLEKNNYSANKLLEKFLTYIDEFKNGSPQSDDLTVVALSFSVESKH